MQGCTAAKPSWHAHLVGLAADLLVQALADGLAQRGSALLSAVAAGEHRGGMGGQQRAPTQDGWIPQAKLVKLLAEQLYSEQLAVRMLRTTSC